MAQEIGSAKAIHGQVTATGPEGARALSVGSPVFKGDTLATAKGAAGSIQFLDKTVLNVGEGSKVSLDQYVYDASKGSGQVLFKMAQGTFRAVTGEIVKQNPESFKMQSPLATIGIRGTETAHTVPGPGQSETSESHLVMVFSGKPVIVQPLGGGAFQVLSQAGVKVEVGKFGAGPIMVMTPQEYKYYQALTVTGLQQGAPQDTVTPPGGQQAKDPQIQAAQNAANKAAADAQAKAAAAAEAKAAADAAAKAAADAAASGDPAAKAAADAAAKAAADAAVLAATEAKAAAELAAKTQAEAFAAQQALALAAAAKAAADAAARTAADAANQATPLTLNPGSIISFSTSTDSSGHTTTTITVTQPGGGNSQSGSGTTAVIVSEVAQDTITPHDNTNDTPSGGDGDPPVSGGTLDLSGSAAAVLVNLMAQPGFYESAGDPTFLPGGTANVIGSSHDDTITGSDSANDLQGGAGNDVIYAMGGNDTIAGGNGSDTLDAGAGNDVVSGGNGADIISAGSGGDSMGGGLDNFDGGAGGDMISMGRSLNGADGLDTIQGGAGTDVLYFTDNGMGANDLDTTRGVEALHLGDATTNITFPASFTAADWADIGGVLDIDGSAIGGDTSATFTFDGSAATADGAFAILGGHHGDTLTGGAGADSIDGGAGGDLIKGGAGNDSLSGGDGNDTISGGAGDDDIQGGDGSNTASYASSTGGIAVDLAEHSASDGMGGHDQLADIQNVIGSAQADDIWGDEDDNVIEGGAGDDDIQGGGGSDTASYASSTGPVSVALDDGYASDGMGGHDQLTDIQNVIGSAQADDIWGDENDNVIEGGAGADTLSGGGGDDTFVFNAGDVVYGESIDGGTGGTTIKTLGSVDFTQAGEGNLLTLDQQNGVTHTVELAQDGTAAFDWDTFEGLSPESVLIVGSEDGSERMELRSFDNGNTFRPDVFVNVEGMDENDRLHFVGGNLSDPDILSYSGYNEDNRLSVNMVSGIVARDGGGFTHSFEQIDKVIGGEGDDTFTGALSGATLDGGLSQSDGNTISYAETSAGVAINISGNVLLDAEGETLAGAGTAANGSGADTLLNFQHVIGGCGNDTIAGSDGDNVISAGEGDDHIYGSFGADTYDGGAGTNTLDYSQFVSDSPLTIDMAAGTASSGMGVSHGFSNIQHVIGGEGDDHITGSGTGDTIEGGGGADTLIGSGTDVLSYEHDPGGVTVNLSDATVDQWDLGANQARDGHEALDQVTGFHAVIGSSHDDGLFGGNDADTLFGGHGDDTLFGGAGGDNIHGGAGDDVLVGGAGNDSIVGGNGTDTLDYSQEDGGGAVRITYDGVYGLQDASGGSDFVSGIEKIVLNNADYTSNFSGGDKLVDAALDDITGGGGSFTLDGSQLNDGYALSADGSAVSNAYDLSFLGGTGDDSLTGGAGNDSLNGGAGENQLFGGLGSDTLVGGSAADTLDGGGGADVLFGQGGADELTGGAGNDIFWFAGTSGTATVTDFASGVDRLCFYTGSGDFSAMDSDWFFDLNACTTTKATLLFDTGDHTLYYDADGTGAGVATVVAAFANNAAVAEADISIAHTPLAT